MIDFGMYEKQEPKILAYKCQKCGTVYYPAPLICKKCDAIRNPATNAGWGTVSLGGACRLLSWTRVWNLGEGYSQKSLSFGIVEFENGLRASGQLAVENPETGMLLDAKVVESDNRPGKPVHIFAFCLKQILGRYGGKS